MKLLPRVYICTYKIEGTDLPQVAIGTHRSPQSALRNNEKHFGLKWVDCTSYSATNLFRHIITMLTPGLYVKGKTKA